jgi:hypothetical protein
MDAQHPACLALEGHEPVALPEGVALCECGEWGDYRDHVLDVLEKARVLMDTRRPFTGYIPQKDPTWANEAHPQGAVGAPGAVANYAERMGLTNPARPAP